MQSTTLRAIIASENPEGQHLLTDVVEREPGVVVVGKAKNALKAMSLARSLRPDVVVVDSRLPFSVGLDSVRLSRISGLDTAMDISHELPRSMVIVLPTTDMITFQEKGTYGSMEAQLYMHTATTSIPIRLRELFYETAPASSLIFAHVKAQERISIRYKVIEICEKATLYSGIAALGGLVLIITFFLAGAGAFLAAGGIASLLLSLAGRAVAAFWPGRKKVRQESIIVENVTTKEAQFGDIMGMPQSKGGAA